LQKQFALARGLETIEPDGVLADVGIDAQLDRRASVPKFVKGGNRDCDLITDAAHIDDCRRRLFRK